MMLDSGDLVRPPGTLDSIALPPMTLPHCLGAEVEEHPRIPSEPDLRVILREELAAFKQQLQNGLTTAILEHFGSGTSSSSTTQLLRPGSARQRRMPERRERCPSVPPLGDVSDARVPQEQQEEPYKPHPWSTRHRMTYRVMEELNQMYNGDDSPRSEVLQKKGSKEFLPEKKPAAPAVGSSYESETASGKSRTPPGSNGDFTAVMNVSSRRTLKDSELRKSISSTATHKVLPTQSGPIEQAMDLFAASQKKEQLAGRGRIKRLVVSTPFEVVSMVMILLNAVQVGLQTDYMAKHVLDKPSTPHRVFEIVFCVFFVIELLLRLYAFGFKFFYMRGWLWNIFDSVLVILQLAEEVIIASLYDAHGEEINSSFLLRCMRILRAVRTMRVLRMALVVEELKLFVACLIHCGKPLFWSMVLIFVALYVASIYFTQMVLITRIGADWPEEVDVVFQNYYGSVLVSCLSLFEGLTGGLDWDVLVQPLFDHVSGGVGGVYIFFQSFLTLAVMNVVTATFIENALRRAEETRHVQLINRARHLFQCLDVDSSGMITLEEISTHFESKAVRALFRELDVETSEAMFLFEVLDVDSSGSISFEEFLNGCVRLQGPAKSMDTMLAATETRKALESHSVILDELQYALTLISDKIFST
eukprot:TRINITY_DN2406_c0_g1_i2.p1 TRINITY_DN2406_c0_g1~~TRINITY_DN2406_c0_g1_i2.p1  ORF type:complete len:665 (-),score=96.66 TRINITY_DN2406_c0_g1_i2:435-2372(-)